MRKNKVNKSQKDLVQQLSKDVKIVDADIVLSPLKKTWDSFFLSANKASDDFLTERASQKQVERESLDD